MQLTQSYYIATYRSSRKGATTFGDLTDWQVCSGFYRFDFKFYGLDIVRN